MKLEAKIKNLPKDKYGFFEEDDSVYNELPIVIFDETDGQGYLVNDDNWGDWLSDFSKERYRHYIEISDIKLDPK